MGDANGDYSARASWTIQITIVWMIVGYPCGYALGWPVRAVRPVIPFGEVLEADSVFGNFSTIDTASYATLTPKYFDELFTKTITCHGLL